MLLPNAGIIVAGLDLWAAIDALERIDWNAWCILSQSAMPAATIPTDRLTMILTLTASAALDRVIFIDEFRPETTMRARASSSAPAAKVRHLPWRCAGWAR